MCIDVTAVKGSSNAITYDITKVVNDVETPYNLDTAGVTRLEAALDGIILPISFSGSTMTVVWGDFNLPADESHTPWIFAYSPASPKGEVLFGPDEKNTIYLKLVEDPRIIPQG